ncbi:hypothetical protein AMECASPLE_027204 [Ameca splendens]|uniref:Uncharacterized protein n=1 Tax=Ameca splendens TaxID=208324 RepID=A0ABV0ZF39_9TELE
MYSFFFPADGRGHKRRRRMREDRRSVACPRDARLTRGGHGDASSMVQEQKNDATRGSDAGLESAQRTSGRVR